MGCVQGQCLGKEVFIITVIFVKRQQIFTSGERSGVSKGKQLPGSKSGLCHFFAKGLRRVTSLWPQFSFL